MNLEELSTSLKYRLEKGLPGWQAHTRMSTQVHRNARVKVPSHTRRAAVLMLLYYDEGELWIPLIRRPDYDGVHGGQMALPGGKVEAEDKDIIATALRETHEEIGVYVQRNQVVGPLSNLYIPPSNITVTPVLAITNDKPTYQADPLEVAEITDVSMNALQNPENYSLKKVPIYTGGIVQAPAFQILGKTIWGATAMMLSELLHIFEELD
ncbi:CoA pyrophosphatase [Porifericola rhodea]|uniref:NUDIX hydrolase n=1 Tax=Porifericola rhodea TaxID=930972 RepID=UPI002665EDB2|nr:CoA pyrophosphatase [Porifericola rhodea]WKN30499.1 CoA pyrophosphatase [Porifericola rhodea]